MTHRRRFEAALFTLILFAALPGCRRKDVSVQQTDEEGPRMSSMVHAGDPHSDTQLVTGFYGVEQNAWRWTAQHFSVVLRPPAGASQKGATLNLQLSVPDPVISKLKTIALSATINGVMLPPESYTQSGQFTYTRDVEPNLLTGEAVKIDFALDKALPPSGTDSRELGVIVNVVSLDPK